LHDTLRKRLKTRGVFPNDASMVKLLYVALQNIAKRWTRPMRDWKAALNQCVILFGERVPVWKKVTQFPWHPRAEIVKLAAQLKVATVVLHPFAHLFAELSAPEVAIDVLSRTQQALSAASLQVYRTPFGWFNTLQIDATGHPMSRGAHMVNADA
jgi:hypothetical protein